MRKPLPNPQAFGKVAVLFGGWAAEREVSLVSGNAVLVALQRAGVDAVGFDADKDIVSQLNDYDRVFNVMHGRGGEDGTIQAALDLAGIPYTGSPVLGSALAMDKLRTKMLWAGMGLPTPKYVVMHDEKDCETVLHNLQLPVMVKPALEGSSIGMSKVSKEEDLLAAYKQAAQYGLVFAEEWITGMEYTAGVLAQETLPLICLETDQDFYDYAAKYERNDTRYLCPCGLDQDKESQLQKLALTAFNAAGVEGWGRVDLMVDESGQPWLIEVNTVPGMTDHSLVPMAAKEAGMSFEELVQRILMTSMTEGESE